MKAIHVKASELTDWGMTTIRMALDRMTGVLKIATLQSEGVISVLFDETRASADQILAVIRSVGVDAVLIT